MSTIHWKGEVFTAFDPSGDWPGDTGAPTIPDPIALNPADAMENAASEANIDKAKGPKLTTLFSFTGANGENPNDGLFADAAGDLFGTTAYGGTDGDNGTVFEIAETKQGYASAPTILASFNVTDGEYPAGALIADAAGDLFGTTLEGGANGVGTVFELAKTKDGYAGAPTTLASFSLAVGESPTGALIADAAGDLIGTTLTGGPNGDGTVFELAKTKRGYASAPIILASFTGADGARANAGLITDAAGDLFGTTYEGGADNDGTVFEIAKTQGGYASAPTTLVSFTGADGANLDCALIADAAGDLFGTTIAGGADNDGTVFEIAKTQGGYASSPTILVSFTAPLGEYPSGGLIADAAGNFFGATAGGGPDNDGTVFEIAKTKSGYASNPTVLVDFTGANGAVPIGSLIGDAAGNLLGTTNGGGSNSTGTVFEIAHSGFVPPAVPATSAVAHGSPPVATFVQAMAATTGAGETAGLLNSWTTQESHQPMLAAPRLAIA